MGMGSGAGSSKSRDSKGKHTDPRIGRGTRHHLQVHQNREIGCTPQGHPRADGLIPSRWTITPRVGEEQVMEPNQQGNQHRRAHRSRYGVALNGYKNAVLALSSPEEGTICVPSLWNPKTDGLPLARRDR